MSRKTQKQIEQEEVVGDEVVVEQEKQIYTLTTNRKENSSVLHRYDGLIWGR